jgi:hypothetical protein
MSTTLGFAEVIEAAETGLVRALDLVRAPLPAGLARLEGSWKDAPVVLEARAYRGERVAYARFVNVQGAGLEIGNILCLSAPAYPLPILGVDLVGLGKDTVVAVADLSPILGQPDDRDGRVRQLDGLASRRARGPALPSGGELPAWCKAWFSPHALFARVPSSQHADVARAVEDYWRAYADLAVAAEPGAGTTRVEDAQRAYCVAHIEHDRGLQMLRKMFDPDLADRFLREVLFPERRPS